MAKNPFAKMMKKEKVEPKAKEKSEKYTNSKASKMDMKIDSMTKGKKGKK
jgi:hypothetical protein